MHLVGFIARIYHDARSSECQKCPVETKQTELPLSNECSVSSNCIHFTYVAVVAARVRRKLLYCVQFPEKRTTTDKFNVLLAVHREISVQYEPTGYTAYFQFISVISLDMFRVGLLLETCRG
jgi:hypothetical protein